MKSPRSHFASRYSVAFILCLSCLMILMASALSVSPNSSLASSTPSNARVSTTATPNPREPFASTLTSQPSPLNPFVDTTVTATKTHTPSGNRMPGDMLMYTVVITNTGAADATNVIFTDTIDPNTTLMGVVASSPIAFNDSYTASGNIPIAPAAGLLANDIDPDTGTNAGLTVTQVQGLPGAVGNPTNTMATGIGSVHGSVTVLANGTFTYEPPPGFTGSDTFTYQISDAGGKTGSGTVTITISQMAWFINNNAAGSLNRGTFNNPYTSTTSFNTANTGAPPNPQPGDVIALRRGTGTYTDVIVLRDNQKLIGEAVAFNSVFTADANSSSAYMTFAAGTTAAPVITTSGGVIGVLLAMNNTVRGLDVGNTPGAYGFAGSAVGNLTVGTVNKTGTGGAIRITTSGAFGSNVNFGTLESTSSPSENILLTSVTGTLGVSSGGMGLSGSAAGSAAVNISGGSITLSYPGSVSKTNAGRVVNVDGTTGGSVSFTGTVTGDSTTTGVNINNANGNVSFATLNLGTMGTRMTNTAVTINTGSAPAIYNLGVVSIFTTGAAKGILSTNTGGEIRTSAGSVVNALGGAAIDISAAASTPLLMNLTSVTANGGTNGIRLLKTTGSFTVTGDGASDPANTTRGRTTAKQGGGSITLGSGGTINNMTGPAVSLNTASNVTLRNLSLTGNAGGVNSGGDGINAVTVTTMTLDNVLVQSHPGNDGLFGSGVSALTMQHTDIHSNATTAGVDSPDVWNVRIDNLTGTSAISNSLFFDSFENVFFIQNNGSSNLTLTVTNSEFRDTSTAGSGNVGFGLSADGTCVTTLTATGSKFANSKTNGFQYAGVTSSSGTVKVQNSTFDQCGVDINIAHQSAGQTLTYEVSGNTMRQTFKANCSTSTNIFLGGLSTAGTVMTGTVKNNSIGNAGVANSGSDLGAGIAINATGAGTVTASVTGNTVVQVRANSGNVFDAGILNTSKLNLNLHNNTFNGNPAQVNPQYGVHINNGSGSGGETGLLCWNMGGNTVTMPATAIASIDLDAFPGTSSNLVGYAGAANNGAQIMAFFSSANTSVTPSPLYTAAGGNTQAATPPCSTFVFPAFVNPEFTALSANPVSDGPSESSSQTGDALRATWGESPNSESAESLNSSVLSFVVQAAIERWRQAGISSEDLARLQAVSFETVDLAGDLLARSSSSQVQVDQTAAGYGWYFDEFPMEDSEFQVLVPEKELQTNEASPANGKVDLLTVVMRELGQIYVQGQTTVTKTTRRNLRPLMEDTLSPGVRRMPLDLLRVTPLSPIGSTLGPVDKRMLAQSNSTDQPEATGAGTEFAVAQSQNETAQFGQARYAASYSATDQTTGFAGPKPTPAMMTIKKAGGANNSRANRAIRVGSMKPMSGETVTVNGSGSGFTIPVGKSVTIMFQAMISNSMPPGVCTVTNPASGSGPNVTGSNFPSFTIAPDSATVVKAVTIGSCPAHIDKNTDLDACTAVATFTTPTADGCPVATVSCSPASGFAFPKGTTTVTCTASNAPGPADDATCSFTVTVTDNQPPTITCPSAVVHSTDPNVCTALITYPNATATDNCPGVGTPSCMPASGTTFAKGVTTVTCTVSDASSNSNTCMFTVTVNDTQAPTVTCPPSGGAFAASDCLPSQRLAYTGATLYSVGPNTVTNVVLSGFTPCTPPPVSGMATINFTGILTGDLTTGGPPTHFQAPATGLMKVTFNNLTGATRTFDTEMLQLDLSGGNLPAGVQLRESPTLVSTGQTKITTVTGGFHIDSFFDVFTELSTNSGANWTPDPTPRHIAAVQSTDAGQCNAVVNYPAATATDNCSGVSAVTCDHASGSTFAKGTTTVTCSATDAGTLPGNCSFTVTVIDTQLPTLSCPSNINVIGNVCQVQTYTTPTPSDNCTGATVVCAPPSGTCFAVGTTTVTCTATDTSANTGSCSFTVTVTPCTITCPNSVSVDAEPGVCTAVVMFADPTTTGSCGTVTCVPASNSTFQKGVTTVTCSTTAGPSCAFTVTVNDTQPPMITCPLPIIQSTDLNMCTAVVTFADPTVTDNCPPCNVAPPKPGQSPQGTPVCSVVCSPVSGSMFPKGVTTVTCTATDVSLNTAQCMFTVTVNDMQPPSITCPMPVVQSTDPNVCTALVTYSNATATDNCPGVGTPSCMPASGTTFAKGETTVTCTVSDASSNSNTCMFTVTVNDTQAPVVTCPAADGAFAASDCLPSQSSAYTGPTLYSVGPNTVTNVVLSNFTPCTPPPVSGMATINFTGVLTGDYSTGGPPVHFQAPATGSMKVTFTNLTVPTRTFDTEMLQLDISGGNLPAGVQLRESPTLMSTGQTKITTVTGGFHIDSFFDVFTELSTNSGANWTPDPTARHIAAVQSTDAGACTAVVNYPAATATDNCSGVSAVTCVPASGTTFSKGTTTVTCSATDAGTLPGNCSFTVTVIDTQLPTLTCPSNINVTGNSCQNVTYTTPAGSDNCPGVSVSCLPASGSTCFAVGTTTVTCTATDTSANTGSCSFTVSVIPCTITCPNSITTTTEPGVCTAVVKFADPTTTGTCGTVTCSPVSGSTFQKGVTTVTCSTTAGPSCAFTVTVNDTQLPMITCPLPIIHNTDPDVCTAVVTFADPTVTDNCPPCNSGGAKPGKGPGVNVGCQVVCSPASGSMFQKGVTTVMCTATDASNNTAMCSFTVTVNDMQPPSITCPLPVVQNTDPNVCTALVTYSNATATDNCPGVGTPGCLPASGTAFAKGVTTVTCTVSDASNNTANCTFTVTINDTQPPAVTCPLPITQNTDPNACTAVVSFADPVITDNCPPCNGGGGKPGKSGKTPQGVPGCSVVCVPASGTAFQKGVTTVTCTATDASNNTAMCTFNVTVNDMQAPVITCPTPITHGTDPNACTAVVTFNTTATDNCPLGPTPVVCTPASGATFQKGVTTVSCTATDTSNNTSNCSFTVTVNDTQNPTITCPSPITQPATAGQCSAVVTYSNATATDNCPGVGTPSCLPASGSTFQKGVTTVTCSVTDASSNPASCTFTVTINDMQPPTITCPANVIKGTDPNVCQAVVTYTAPTVADNCPGIGAPVCTPASGTTFQKGVTTVSCTVSDASKNSATCTFTVTVNDTQNPSVTCPANITFTTPGNSDPCGVVTYATPAGSDNCPLGPNPVSCTPASGTCFLVGMTTVTCTVTDTSNRTGQCTFKVTVQNPCTITCPANITKGNDPNQCGAVVTFAPMTTGGGCGTVACSPSSGSFFPKGTTTVTCTTAGPSCSFTVTVNDTQPPNITCPANITQGTDPDQCQAVVTYPAPTVSDNCPGVGPPTCSPASGTIFPKGSTTVTCTVKDSSNNMSMCSFTITVNDNQPPVLVGCSAGIFQTAQVTCPITTTLIVTYTTPTATDNCAPPPTVICNPPSGSTFPVGTTSVTCTATDSSGNTTTCSFPVSVFSFCLQDDSIEQNVAFVNAITGDYLFCQNGVPLASGTGTLVMHGCNFQIDHTKGNRKVHIQGDTAGNSGMGAGTAYIQKLGGGFVVQITDRKMTDDTCLCAPLPPPPPDPPKKKKKNQG